MAYTVGEMARRLGLPASTLRYYDKEGLLPFVGRSSGGIRVFTEKDFEWLRIIECLKKTGMSLKDIREYIELAMQGDETIARRLELFRKQRTVLEARMAELQQTMDALDYKCWFYETAAARGSTEGISDLPDEALPEALRPVRERLRAAAEAETEEVCPQNAAPAKRCGAFLRHRCADYNNPPRKNPAVTAISGAAAYNLPPDKTENLKKSCREVLNTAQFP